MLDGQQASGDVLALQEILSAPEVSPDANFGALFTGIVAKRSTVKIVPVPAAAKAVAVCAYSRYAAHGDADGVTTVWDTSIEPRIETVLGGHSAAITGLMFNPDGRRIVSGSDDRTLHLWDVEHGTPIGAPLTEHTEKVTGVAFSPDGERIVASSDDGTVRLWDSATQWRFGRPIGNHAGRATCVAFSPDGRRIISGGTDHDLRLSYTTRGGPIGDPTAVHRHDAQRRILPRRSADRLRRTRLRRASLGRRDDDTARPAADRPHQLGDGRGVQPRRQPDRLQERRRHHETVGRRHGRQIGQPLAGHTGAVTGVPFSPDGRILSGGNDSTVRI